MAIAILDWKGGRVKTADFASGRVSEVQVVDITRSGPFTVKAHDLGNGHLEITAARQQVATELDWPRSRILDHMEMVDRYRELHADELREKSIAVAANRAKTRVRKLCKAMGADTMLTLTYRSNMQDLELCKKHLKEFVRRVTRELPDFGLVAAFEEQKRGAWHVHGATCRIPKFFHRVCYSKHGVPSVIRTKSFDVLRAIWRSVTKEHQGNVDVSRRKGGDRTPARIASYIAKYISKGYAEGEKWSNRWTKFGVSEVPKAINMGTVDRPLDLLDVAFSFLSREHEVVGKTCWSHFGDWLYLAAEIPKRRSVVA
ncbi:hypothetical protein J2W23_000223 [Variovorax boronicumulans]|uniref:rolling circle replication-associated protein n=1 Tax=Variovorax boronicumulans TaxID=436515 RepID=UPI002783A3E6|nr:hypothetical protein [Variovorax boronicumulans]MDQ0011859.1 hypothetical protein [Variovorax boronicumulans]